MTITEFGPIQIGDPNKEVSFNIHLNETFQGSCYLVSDYIMHPACMQHLVYLFHLRKLAKSSREK